MRAMDTIAERESLLLPSGTRLVHIGPPKTATSAVQGSFHAARAATEAQGVHYAGSQRHSGIAVQAVTGRAGFYTDGKPAPMRHWHRLMRDVRSSRAGRVVISSEFFADALPESIPAILADLDPSRVHVVVTLRPLAKILPSQWQQYVQSGMLASYDVFLDRQFNEPEGSYTPTFWRRHRHDRLVERWASAVGPDNVTVIALDETDREMVLRTFEQLTGLRTGTLTLQPEVTNRSMTMPEIEAVRAFNRVLRAEGLGSSMQSGIVHFGTAPYMRLRTPEPDEMKVETPQWALDRVATLAREMVDTIANIGVRVVGDLDTLAVVAPSRLEGEQQPPVLVPPAVAASMAMGVVYASGLAGNAVAGPDRSGPRSSAARIGGEPADLVRVPTRALVTLLVRRGLTSVRRRLPGGKKRPA